MSSAPPLLSAGQPSRSASGVVAKPARGFQVFRIDGFSWTKTLPGGERLSSEQFTVGGRAWHIDFYPNGNDGSKDDSDAVSLFLRLHNTYKKERVRAQYKFSLLDAAGAAAYELPAETGVFTCPGPGDGDMGYGGHSWEEPEGLRCGYAGFITREELERRRESLLRDDCLAVRCDVGVMEVAAVPLLPKHTPRRINRGYDDDEDDEEEDGSRDGRRRQQPADDREFIRRCLTAQRRRA